MGRQSGITQEKLHALADYAQSPLFSETERLCLEYADHMTRTPVEVPDALFAELRARFDAAQLVELGLRRRDLGLRGGQLLRRRVHQRVQLSLRH